MEISPEKLCDNALEEVYPSFLLTMLSDLSPNLQGSSNGQPLFADLFGHNANAISQLTSHKSLDRSRWLLPIRGGSRIRMVHDSSGEKHWFLDSPKTFEQNANAGPQVTSDESIPPWLRPWTSTSEKQNYDESSHYLSGHSNRFSIFQNAPKTPPMPCGTKCQDTADNIEDGESILGPIGTVKSHPLKRRMLEI